MGSTGTQSTADGGPVASPTSKLPFASRLSAEVRAFFDRFEQASDALDVDTIATKFAEVFMNADPNGVATVPRDAFLAALPQRQKLFDGMGVRDIRLTELSESRLEDSYILVDTQRAAILNDPSAPPLALSSSLILRQNGDSLALVFYVNHQDIMALARTAEAAELAKVWPACCALRFR